MNQIIVFLFLCLSICCFTQKSAKLESSIVNAANEDIDFQRSLEKQALDNRNSLGKQPEISEDQPKSSLDANEPADKHIPDSSYFLGQSDSLTCSRYFDFESIKDWREGLQEYCGGNMRCFTNKQGHNQGKDVFCELFDAQIRQDKRIFVECNENPVEWQILKSFPRFMYNTGLGVLFSDLRFQKPECKSRFNKTAIFVKREGFENFFHCLAEILDYFITIAVLGMKNEKTAIVPENTQIVFIDSLPDGILVDLWKLFAVKVSRLSDFAEGTCFSRAVFVLPGGSAPFWRADWTPFECKSSQLYSTFVNTILNFYQIPLQTTVSKPSVTFISRRGKHGRTLINEDQIFDKIRKKFPFASVRQVDFAANLTLKEQIEIVRETNILVGIHGAGLTNLLWLPEEAVVIEIFAKNFKKAAYRNMAKLLGKDYFMMESESPVHTRGSETWVRSDYKVDDEKLIEIVTSAVYLSLNFGKSNLSVN